MADSSQTQLIEELTRRQLVTQEHLDEFTADVRQLSDTTRHHQNWIQTENFAAEEEVHAAIENHFASDNVEVLEVPFKAIFGPGGKHAYSFDGTYRVGDNKLLLVETKHRVVRQDVVDLLTKKQQLQLRLNNIRDGQIPAGKTNYMEQLQMLSNYVDFELQPVLGGVMFDGVALDLALKSGCMIVKASGGRFQVVS